jgi:hypothetical protein
MKELNSNEGKSVYSYLQYHWWPIVLIVNLLKWVSSSRYKILIEGSAIIIRMNMGIMVQISSIKLLSKRNRFKKLLEIKENIIIEIKIVINVIIIIVKSWKKISMSHIGEFES